MLCAIGEASHTANWPISDGSDMRRDGCFSESRLAMPASRSPPAAAARASTCGRISEVSVQPGQMQLTVMAPSFLSPLAAY